MKKFTKQEFSDQYQEDICKMCEESILGCSSISSTFICEGVCCEEAFNMFIEDNEEFEVVEGEVWG